MVDRLVIEMTGALPEAGKYAILASAEDMAKTFAADLGEAHGVELTVSVRAVRPGKKAGAITAAEIAGTRHRAAAE